MDVTPLPYVAQQPATTLITSHNQSGIEQSPNALIVTMNGASSITEASESAMDVTSVTSLTPSKRRLEEHAENATESNVMINTAMVHSKEERDDEHMASNDEKTTPSSSPQVTTPLSSLAVTSAATTYNARVEGQKSRAFFSPEHNALLENIFTTIQYPTKEIKASLAVVIQITEVQVGNWFSRRRKKASDEALEKKQHIELLQRLAAAKEGSTPSQTTTPVPSVAAPSAPSAAADAPSAASLASALALVAALKNNSGNSSKVEVPKQVSTGNDDAKRIKERAESPKQEQEPDKAPKKPFKLRADQIAKKLTVMLRGGALIKAEDIPSFTDLMEQAQNYDGKRYILTALLSTKSSSVRERFVNSKGPRIFREWMNDARVNPRDSHNADLLYKSMLILKNLPFTVDSLVKCKLGKVVRLLARDSDDGSASELESNWRRLATAQTSGSHDADRTATTQDDRKSLNSLKFGHNTDSMMDATPALPKFKKGAKAASQLQVSTSGKDTPPKPSPKVTENAGFFKELAARPASSSPSFPSPAKRARGSSPTRSDTHKSSPQASVKDESITTPPASPLVVKPPSPPLPKPASRPLPMDICTSVKPPSPPLSTASLSEPLMPSTQPMDGVDTSLSSATSFEPQQPVMSELTAPSELPEPSASFTSSASSESSEPSTIPESSSIYEPSSISEPSVSSEASESLVHLPSPPGSKTSSLRKSSSGKKKVVRFKADHELEMVRLIEPRNHEYYSQPQEGVHAGGGYDDHMGTGESQDSAMFNNNVAERPQFLFSSEEEEAVLVEGKLWREPVMILLDESCTVPWGADSTEKETQEIREQSTLSATYLQNAYIPFSPEEPDEEPYNPYAPVKPIPLFE
ncbi:hypothetical protein BGZ94_006095, partial [Podila epigama]